MPEDSKGENKISSKGGTNISGTANVLFLLSGILLITILQVLSHISFSLEETGLYVIHSWSHVFFFHSIYNYHHNFY